MPPAAQARSSSGTMSGRRSALLLMGPTGAGKSELALDLARRFPFEIVSVDSAQVYRGMDIGTAKPDPKTRALIPHHLIDIRDPETSYSAGEFVRDASAVMREIWTRGRQPLLVGGTMLYFHALLDGMAQLPEADQRVRADIEARAAAGGWAALHEELRRVDPAAAARIHVNDPQRIQRALEVYRVTGEPITRLQQSGAPAFAEIEVLEFAISPEDRAVLHARIATRFEAMWAAGFLDEVRRLRQRSTLGAEHPSMRAVGYRQLWKFLSGHCSLEDSKKQALAATRQLAKRQLTWLRRRQRATWVDSAQTDPTSAVVYALSAGGFAGWSYA
jgi:tRNA dimethylallyltransferase